MGRAQCADAVNDYGRRAIEGEQADSCPHKALWKEVLNNSWLSATKLLATKLSATKLYKQQIAARRDDCLAAKFYQQRLVIGRRKLV